MNCLLYDSTGEPGPVRTCVRGSARRPPTSGRPDPGHLDSGRPTSGRPDPGRPDPGHLDSGRPDPGRPDPGRPTSGRPDPGRPTSGRPDPGHLDSGRSDPGRPDPGHLDSGRPASGHPAPASATGTIAGLHLAAYSLGAGHGFVLGVVTPQRASGDRTVAGVAAVLLSLLTGEQQSGTGAARSSALLRLLLGARPEEVAPLLGDGPWVVVHARPDTDGAPGPVAASALGAALGSALVDPAGETVRVLVPPGRAPDPLPGWTLGVSAAVAPEDWAAADTQAARALARARATRAPLLRHSARPALAGLVPPGETSAHARALLAPVTDHPALTETLRTWLSLHGSWDRTAVALTVHRNTVRQRIARCASLLGADLDDPDVRMELWFALRQL
ncbi:helix-turn-helix domain-containing protein [Streptomyces sp. NPDC058735]|uniref:helix-turn-helix domain-containing protein n=1 Tax=Streptomyces sp. NPDC058735 TaxID=3346616 RepID=UPI0036D7E0ED